MHDRLSVGRTIARLRNQHGLSQEELARNLQLAGLDLSRDMIMNIERGRVGLTITVLAQIARILDERVIEFTPKASGNKRCSNTGLDCRVTVYVHLPRRKQWEKTNGGAG